MTDDRICVGRIGAPHGVRGEVRLWAFTEDPMTVMGYGPLETEDASRTFTIEAMRPAKDHFVARLAGIDDRSKAEALTNARLFVRRARLPQPEDEDTFYHADLIGLAAMDPNGSPIGTVLAVHNFGAGDVIEIQPPQGPSVMLPFTKAVVPTVDLQAKRIVIDAPEGSFEG